MLHLTSRPGAVGLAMATVLLSAGCGAVTEPAPLQAMKPEVPADLCATVPATARTGLLANSNTDETGNPTAACSLRTPDGAATEMRAVVTWVQTDNDTTAVQVLDSQCRAIDRLQFREQSGYRVAGADKACAASGKVDGADSATLAAATGREVVTVRLSSKPPTQSPAMGRAQQMLEGVIHSLTGAS